MHVAAMDGAHGADGGAWVDSALGQGPHLDMLEVVGAESVVHNHRVMAAG